jgi:anti-sigma B factor antagonist
MQLSTRQIGDVSVIDVTGKNPGARAASIRDAIVKLHASGHFRIVLNLAELEYMDSSALGDLVSCNTRASQSGRPLKVAALTHRLKDLLRVTRLATTFDIYETLDEALASYPPRPVDADTAGGEGSKT